MSPEQHDPWHVPYMVAFTAAMFAMIVALCWGHFGKAGILLLISTAAMIGDYLNEANRWPTQED